MLASRLEVLWTARFDYQPHWKLERHQHKYFQMIYFLSGSGRFFLDDREYPISRDTVFLIKPQQIHGLNADSTVKTLDIKFMASDPQLRRSLLQAHSFVEEKNSSIPHLFERIRWEGERKGYLFRELCRTYLIQMLILYLRQDRGRLAKETRVVDERQDLLENDLVSQKAIEFIKAHYAEDLSLEHLARHVGVSDRHLRQRFKESAGLSPMRYLVRYRVDAAKNLISYSNYALKVVAELVGFKNVHHFTRVFREITGEAPGAWRRRYLDGICKDVCIDPHFSNIILTAKEGETLESLQRARAITRSRSSALPLT
ncbi:MAG: helix-turn-helix domain-containing protein [Terriglobia bacterium]